VRVFPIYRRRRKDKSTRERFLAFRASEFHILRLDSSLDLSTPQRINWEAAKSDEISRLKSDIKQLKAEQLKNFGGISEANDSIARLKDENYVLKSQLAEERQFLEKLETTMVDAKHQLSIERVKVSYCEEEMDHVRKENRRLVRESDFLKSDLSIAEKDLKASKECCASLQRDLREVGTKLNQKTNTLFLMADEESLLKNEISALNQVPFI
jgi:chromosome segregation ATPase